MLVNKRSLAYPGLKTSSCILYDRLQKHKQPCPTNRRKTGVSLPRIKDKFSGKFEGATSQSGSSNWFAPVRQI